MGVGRPKLRNVNSEDVKNKTTTAQPVSRSSPKQSSANTNYPAFRQGTPPGMIDYLQHSKAPILRDLGAILSYMTGH